MKYVVFLLLSIALIIAGCSEPAQTVIKGTPCSYHTECGNGEICLENECVSDDSYDCTQSNNYCPIDLACSQVSGKCKIVECSNHSECGDGQFCNGNFCKTGCKNNVECGEGYDCNLESGECDLNADVNCLTNPEICTEVQVCNTETKECVDKEQLGCINDFECDYEHGEMCNTVSGECEMDPNYCADSTTCPTNYECRAHHCEPIGGTECSIDEECSELGEYCNNGDGGTNTCVQCLEDSHCTSGSCNIDTKKCIIVQSCTDDSTCPEGTKCVLPDGMMPGMGNIGGTSEGSCQEVEVCYLDADCNPEGTPEADYEKYCKRNDGTADTEPGYCATSNNFTQDDLFGDIGSMIGICIDGILPCSDGGECVGDFIGHCEGGGGSDCSGMLGEMTCTNNGGTCVNGVCQGEVEAECYDNGDCADLYPDQDNLICQRGGCMEDPTPRCPSGDSDCTEQMYCDPSNQICYSCVTDAHCDNGSVCRDHNCISSSFCTSDSDCEAGQECRANICR